MAPARLPLLRPPEELDLGWGMHWNVSHCVQVLFWC